MHSKPNTKKIFQATLIVMCAGLLMAAGMSLEAQETRRAPVTSPKLELAAGKSMVLKTYLPVKRVSVAAPEIADFILISPKEVYIQAKKPGTTNMILWKGTGMDEVYDIEVTQDLSGLKRQLHEILPYETDIRVFGGKDAITIMGRVSNAMNLKQALSLAGSYAPEGKVNNYLEVGGVHQVMLEVKVAEISRSVGKAMGVNFDGVKGNEFGVNKLDGLRQIVLPQEQNIFTHNDFYTYVSPAVNALYRFTEGEITYTMYLDALKEDGLAKVLAEPTLIALSGKSASFLAGGEFPVPIPDDDGIAIEYKPYGVRLSFTPTVLDQNRINIKVSPEVSELDFSSAVRIVGYVIPGLTKRTAETTIDLANGESFAIAGLLQENVRESVAKYPLLGELPILGALFSSKSFQKNETELIIIVTPHLVQPLDQDTQTLPTDFYQEPNDFEFYLNTVLTGLKKKKDTPNVTGGFDGQFGHSFPEEEQQIKSAP